jgi:hypothetical protein
MKYKNKKVRRRILFVGKIHPANFYFMILNYNLKVLASFMQCC